jgi:hypothetical protein
VITAIGIREMYRFARSCGVGMRQPHNLFASSRPARSSDRRRILETLSAPVTRCATTKAMIFSCQKPDLPWH